MGRSAMAMKALLLCAMVVCAASIDCDTLAEPERTRCLDRAADMNIQMVPVDEEIIPSAAAAQEDLKLAQASTAGMYDDDVKVARAFSDLTDSMDDLKVHMGQLKMKTNVAKKVQEVKEEFAREEEERSRELGESDSTSVKKESLGILDATEADLDKDLTVDYHPDTKPNNDATVDDILGKLHADEQELQSQANDLGEAATTSEDAGPRCCHFHLD